MLTDSALLVIDVQVGLVAGKHPVSGAETLFAHINKLIAQARASETMIIYVQDVDVAPLDSPAFKVHPSIASTNPDLVIHKRAADAFYDTPLHEQLTARGIKHLVITGCKTEFCVDTTCRLAPNLGYDVTLVADAHTTTDSTVLPAAQIIAHHNRLLHGFGVDDHCVLVRETNRVQFPAQWPGWQDEDV